jgi:membrane protein insertase Oxa1/YidC/SpoIIIJ
MVLANIFRPLIDIFGPVLVFFHSIIGGSWGWSIIALTFVIRALLLPLAFKQMHSMQKLQQVGPARFFNTPVEATFDAAH